MAVEEHDTMNHWRCPMLGGPVPFRHCRTTNDGLPCTKLEACWGAKIDMETFLKTNYTEDEIRLAFAPPPGRVERILETVEKFSDQDRKA